LQYLTKNRNRILNENYVHDLGSKMLPCKGRPKTTTPNNPTKLVHCNCCKLFFRRYMQGVWHSLCSQLHSVARMGCVFIRQAQLANAPWDI